jgi:hypothetical protein
LRFTLPSPIHFGYGVAYRASPGAKASRVRLFTRPGLQVDSCELVSSLQ